MGNQRELTPEQRAIANLGNNPDFQQLVRHFEEMNVKEAEASLYRIIADQKEMIFDAAAKGRVQGNQEVFQYVKRCALQVAMEKEG